MILIDFFILLCLQKTVAYVFIAKSLEEGQEGEYILFFFL